MLRRLELRFQFFWQQFHNMPEISQQLVDQLATMAEKLSLIAESLAGTANQVAPEYRDRYEHRLQNRLCLNDETPFVEGERFTRGLCYGCYQRAYAAMRKDATLEQRLIHLGLIAPDVSKGGRKPKISGDPLANAIAGLESDEELPPGTDRGETVVKKRKKST